MVRCGMCGKQNPASNAVCEFCGARLRPMTAEELGLTPSTPPASSAPPSEEPRVPEPPLPAAPTPSDEEDPFAELRDQYFDDDPTLIGASASKDRIGKQDLFQDVEPDFTFGPDEPAETSQQKPATPQDDFPGSIPDWLSEASKPRDTGPLQTPLGAMPDWLQEETSTSTPPPSSLSADEIDIPDWLGQAESKSATTSPAQSEAENEPFSLDVPDWLDATARSESTRQMPVEDQTPDWLSGLESPADEDATTRAQTTQPMSPIGSDPNWLEDQAEEELPREPSTGAEPSAALPDWLYRVAGVTQETSPSPDEEDLDWLRPSAEMPASEESPVNESTSPIPDWLQDAAEIPTSQAEAAQSVPPVEQDADWLRPPAEMPVESAIAEGVPDWLQDAAPSDRPAAESEGELEAEAPQAPLISTGIPDWLTQAAAPQEETPAEAAPLAQVPDWLEQKSEEIEAAETETEPIKAHTEDLEWLRPAGEETVGVPEPSSEQTEAADWLRVPSEEQPAESQAPTEEAGEAELPGWLSGLGLGAVTPSEPEVPAPTPMSEEPSGPELEVGVPDWLAEMGGSKFEPAPEHDHEHDEAAEVELPDWMPGLETASPESGQSHQEVMVSSQEAESTSPTAEPEVPDWLASISGEPSAPAAPSAQAEPASSATEPEVPDWLASMGGETSMPATPSAETELTSPAGELEVPDWLASMGGEPSVPAAPSSAAEPEAPDWLSSLGSEPAAPAVPTDLESEPEAPDWLAGLGGQPSESAMQPEIPSPAEQPSETPDWLAGIGTGTPATPQEEGLLGDFEPSPSAELSTDSPDWLADLDDMLEVPSTPAGEDLLGFPESLQITETAEEEDIDISAAELPEWLRGVAPGDEGASERAAGGLSANVPSELAGLRFEAITGERRDEPATETVGALKDVTGVIRPELLFDGASLQVGNLVDQLIVTNEQQRRISTLEALLEREKRGVVVAAQPSTIPLVRLLISLLMLLTIAGAVFLSTQNTDVVPDPRTSIEVSAAHDLIAKLPSGSNVVMAFEYEPETAAEMEPLSVAILQQLARRGDVHVYMMTTRAAGPAMAEHALAAVTNGSTDSWVNFGYISGGSKGISGLVIGTLPGVVSPISYDYRGKSTEVTASRLADLNPSLIVIISSRWDDLRAWVEQVEPKADLPMIAAISASSAPMAYPYMQNEQLKAIVVGVNDAVAYGALENSDRSPGLRAAWNGQVVGSVAAVLLILIGSLIYGFRAFRQQQEQE